MNFLQKKKEEKAKSANPNSSKSQKVDDSIAKLFRPGKNIDVVFYSDSLSQYVRPALIHDCDHNSRTIIISQTNPMTHLSTPLIKMGITTLIARKSGQKKRVGVNCKITKLIRDYALNDRTKEHALAIKYSKPMEMYNIREAYRFEPPVDYEITGHITHKGKVYQSRYDFLVYNISIGGIGIMVKNSKKNGRCPLLQMSINENMKTELNIPNFDSKEHGKTLLATTEVVWKNPAYSVNFGYIGTRFVKTDQDEINVLQKFIHNGQMISIRTTQGFES